MVYLQPAFFSPYRGRASAYAGTVPTIAAGLYNTLMITPVNAIRQIRKLNIITAQILAARPAQRVIFSVYFFIK
jgi:hypothetical protein